MPDQYLDDTQDCHHQQQQEEQQWFARDYDMAFGSFDDDFKKFVLEHEKECNQEVINVR